MILEYQNVRKMSKKYLPLYIHYPLILQILVPIYCKWTGFLDSESPVQRFIVAMGSEQGASNVYSMEVPGYFTEHSIQGKLFFIG